MHCNCITSACGCCRSVGGSEPSTWGLPREHAILHDTRLLGSPASQQRLFAAPARSGATQAARQDRLGHRRPLSFSRLEGTGLTLDVHACISRSSLPVSLLGRIADQYRISGAIRFLLFPAPWVLGLHRSTICIATLPPYHWLRLIFCGSTLSHHTRSSANSETFAVHSVVCATS